MLPCPFPTTITITPRAPPFVFYYRKEFILKVENDSVLVCFFLLFYNYLHLGCLPKIKDETIFSTHKSKIKSPYGIVG